MDTPEFSASIYPIPNFVKHSDGRDYFDCAPVSQPRTIRRRQDDFRMVIRKYFLKFNESKCTYSITQLKYLGYLIFNGEIKSDHERLQRLIQLPTPNTLRSLKRAVGFFHITFAEFLITVKIRPLLDVNKFPLNVLQLVFPAIKRRNRRSFNSLNR
ncbi:hypothetical protein GJ496_002459 [Pomphorhynchus laevis]|nr:hypothetical protein GJ496_002459 [Pomphorhynchus laevis]